MQTFLENKNGKREPIPSSETYYLDTKTKQMHMKKV